MYMGTGFLVTLFVVCIQVIALYDFCLILMVALYTHFVKIRERVFALSIQIIVIQYDVSVKWVFLIYILCEYSMIIILAECKRIFMAFYTL